MGASTAACPAPLSSIAARASAAPIISDAQAIESLTRSIDNLTGAVERVAAALTGRAAAAQGNGNGAAPAPTPALAALASGSPLREHAGAAVGTEGMAAEQRLAHGRARRAAMDRLLPTGDVAALALLAAARAAGDRELEAMAVQLLVDICAADGALGERGVNAVPWNGRDPTGRQRLARGACRMPARPKHPLSPLPGSRLPRRHANRRRHRNAAGGRRLSSGGAGPGFSGARGGSRRCTRGAGGATRAAGPRRAGATSSGGAGYWSSCPSAGGRRGSGAHGRPCPRG